MGHPHRNHAARRVAAPSSGAPPAVPGRHRPAWCPVTFAWSDPLVDEEEPDLALAAFMAAGPAEVPDLLEMLLGVPAWHAEAACRGQGTAAFFPERGQSTEPARRLCAGCPVIVECAEAGQGEEHGIWGGTSGRGRKTLRRDGVTLTEDQLRANAHPRPKQGSTAA